MKKHRKLCPECNKELGTRTILCNCRYHFPTKEIRLDLLEEKKKRTSDTNKVYDEIGQGRKTCPSCNLIIAAVIKNCFNCNFDFLAAKKERDDKEEIERQEKREKRLEEKRIKKERKEKGKREEKERVAGENGGTIREEKMHPEVKKMMDSYELIEKMNNVIMNGATYFTPDEHADRILQYGENRIKNLLRQSKNNHNSWKHVNWDRVEAGIKEKV